MPPATQTRPKSKSKPKSKPKPNPRSKSTTKTIPFVTNPETGRLIKAQNIPGSTYARLKDQYSLQSAPRYYKPAPHARYPRTGVSASQLRTIKSMKTYRPNWQRTLRSTTQPALLRKLKTESVQRSRAQGRGQRTRGWAADSPKRGYDRTLLKEKCGDACFLKPSVKGFPICPRCYK